MRSDLRVYFPIAVVCVLGVAMTCTAAYWLYQKDVQQKRASFRDHSEDYIRAIRQAIHDGLDSLYAVASFYQAADRVDRRSFATYVGGLLNQYAYIRSLGWIPRVPKSEQGMLERAARRDGLPNFQIHARDGAGRSLPVSSRREYFPVYYVEPCPGYENLLGFDLASDITTRETLEYARDSGALKITPPISLTQGGGNVLMGFVPVYRDGAALTTPQERWQNIRGFVLGVFRLDALVNQTVRLFESRGIHVAVYDVLSSRRNQLMYLYRSPGPSSPVPQDLGREHLRAEADATHRRFDVGGRYWEVVCLPAGPHWRGSWMGYPLLVMVVGNMFTCLVGCYFWMVIKNTRLTSRLNRVLKQEIEERARAERKILHYTRKIERSNSELEQFAYMASHDLQEPLRKICSFADLLKQDIEKGSDAEVKEDLSIMTDAAGRMSKLIRSLLAYSRVGKNLHMREISLDACLDAAMDNLAVAIRENHVALERVALPQVYGDPELLTQVFQNLIGNAVKFADARPNIEITLQKAEGTFVIGVKDNGIGIKPEYATRIFDPFRRLHGRTEYPGTGIGLSICQKVVRLHEGDIWVESDGPGRGSHFRFTLPRPPARV